MGEPACDLLTAELALDRLEAQLAAELPAHVRAFADAYARGLPAPPAPDVARRPASIAVVRNSLAHAELADRAAGLARLIVPLAIEEDAAVARAYAGERTWAGLAALARARDAAARAHFGIGFLPLVHALHGCDAATRDESAGGGGWPEPVEGWLDEDPGTVTIDIDATWRELAARHGAAVDVELAQSDVAHPRAFVVRHALADVRGLVTVVSRRTALTPAARFEIRHELGHAIAAGLAAAGLPRVVDEAVAAYIARGVEDPREHGWYSALAAAARQRRGAVAGALAALEHRLYATGAAAVAQPPTPRPPWALWHDAGAQAAYVAAERIAERWHRDLGTSPAPGELARAITEERAQIDRRIIGIG